MDRFIYFDIEYRDNRATDAILMMAYTSSDDRIPRVIDLRDSAGHRELNTLVQDNTSKIWVGYNVAADLTCLHTLGVDVDRIRFIDAMAEARMITLTHPAHHSFNQGLLWTMDALGLPVANDSVEKTACRDLILNQSNYSVEEWHRIQRYCLSDVIPLPDLLIRCWEIHESAGSPIDSAEMVFRGEYLKKRTLLDLCNLGFPVDERKCRQIADNKASLIRGLQDEVNQQYASLYHEVGEETLKWSQKNFAAFVDQTGISWEKTPSGQPVTQKAYLKEKSRQHPDLDLLYQVRKTIQALNTADVSGLVSDHHVKPPVYTFAQKTGRESPKPSKGFLLGLPSWQRSLIKPRPQTVMIAADWSQQEIAIAAALSGDREYLDLYDDPSGDVYMALAVRAGAIQPGMDELTRQRLRTTFKVVQLGLGYGKGLTALSEDIYYANLGEENQPLLTFDEAEAQARHIYWWHKETFATYWLWIEDSISKARQQGYIRSLDGWTYFVDDKVRDTQLLNFPMQSNGAFMMRRAVEHCYESGDIDLICTLHDALYITAPASAIRDPVALVRHCMDAACRDVLGHVVTIRTDLAVYDAIDGYGDPRGE